LKERETHSSGLESEVKTNSALLLQTRTQFLLFNVDINLHFPWELWTTLALKAKLLHNSVSWCKSP